MSKKKFLEFSSKELSQTWETLTPAQQRMLKLAIGGCNGKMWPALLRRKLAMTMIVDGHQIGWKLNRHGFALAAWAGNKHALREIRAAVLAAAGKAQDG